ncbi:MAG: amino acid ABC transporter permease [Proteobacteria bacterium]|nr:amino acid ABC transporter permease [Pseudomonadota bacterium]
MGVISTLLRAFVTTLELTFLSAILSLVVGILAAAMRVSPVPPLRWAVSVYVRLVRNTPLTIVFFITVFGLPQVGVNFSFFSFALLALTLYTATFVAETVRAGIQAIPIGQIEAARSIGLTFTQVLAYVVLPQAVRSVVPPLASTFIALFKNSSIASAFGVAEAISVMTNMVNVHSTIVLSIMGATAAIYVALALLFGRAFTWLERKALIAR